MVNDFVCLLIKQFFFCFFSTLYCAKGNYEFGISRIMKSLEPYNKKVRCSFFEFSIFFNVLLFRVSVKLSIV